VDGDEKVGFGIVGYLCPSVQTYEYILLAGVDNVYILTVGLDEFPQFQSNVQVDGLLFAPFTDGTGVSAPMTGVDNYRECSAFCFQR
jgi:hypothetical protein